MKTKGFTLIELMIVIAIIAILASIIIPNIAKARAQAQLRACISNLQAMKTAIVMWQADNPSATGSYCSETGADGDFIPDYLARMPQCPSGYGNWGYHIAISINNDGSLNCMHVHCSPSNHDLALNGCTHDVCYKICGDWEGWCPADELNMN
ncbi:MAG: prepilin-type N-terminal cleavage/methylation domain-containing protein [Vulcanimicrobiota bacterium]